MPRQKKETMQQKRERAARVVAVLKEHYPATCSLEAQKDYELLFATRLSAQCTDARVNIVTKDLYAKYPTLESFAEADMEELCAVIKGLGGAFGLILGMVGSCALVLLISILASAAAVTA